MGIRKIHRQGKRNQNEHLWLAPAMITSAMAISWRWRFPSFGFMGHWLECAYS